VELLIRYQPPHGQDADERSLREGGTIVVGRNPGSDGLKLFDADRGISRRAFEITSLGGEDVYIENKNSRSLVVQCGRSGWSGQDLRDGEGHMISGDGWILIRETHRIEFEVVGLSDSPADPTPVGEKTLDDVERTLNSAVWNGLHENYKDVCRALCVAWIMPDVAHIARQTVPTDMQVASLLGFTATRTSREARRLASQKFERTKEAVRRGGGPDLYGPGSRTELAQWAYPFVTPADIEALRGWSNFE
jgi:hypothetical protein